MNTIDIPGRGGKIGFVRRTGALVLVGLLALFFASSAQAATVTIGQLFSPTANCGGPNTFLQTGVASGASYTVPATGVITSWSFEDAASTVPGLKLKVGRAAGGGSYTITAEQAAGAQTANTVNTYAASIPVQAGDLIGVSITSNAACGSNTINAGDAVVSAAGDQGPGTTNPYTPATGFLLAVSAQIVRQPGISSVSPSAGPTAGGTSVTITGHDFTGASAVGFGGVPAQRFTVNSDTSITAIAPAGAPGPVDVTVTTAGGQSPTSTANNFTYVSPPSVTSVAPSAGPRTGGTAVTIVGRDFTNASAVLFGGRLAASFRVVADTVLTAVSPAAPTGTVDIVVVSPDGQSAMTAADQFTFAQVCIVPKLKGKRLKGAKRALRAAHCRLGTVRGPTTGTVKHPSRKPGKILPAGTKVNLTLT